MFFEAQTRSGSYVALCLDHVSTVEGLRNTLMLKDLSVEFPEPDSRSFALWSCAIRHSMILTIPRKRDGLQEFYIDTLFGKSKFATFWILASARTTRAV